MAPSPTAAAAAAAASHTHTHTSYGAGQEHHQPCVSWTAASASGAPSALASASGTGTESLPPTPRGPLLSLRRAKCAHLTEAIDDAQQAQAQAQAASKPPDGAATTSSEPQPSEPAVGDAVTITIDQCAAPSAATAAAIAAVAASPPSVESLIPPRKVHERLWLGAFVLPLLLWLAATGAALGLQEASDTPLFFAPDAADVSRNWVRVGWALNWTAAAAHVALVVLVRWRHSPFSGAVTLGSLLHVTLMALAAIAHSNALRASEVLSPASGSKVVAVQLEWLAFFLQLVVFLALLLQAPHRVPLPVVADLKRRPQIELLSVLRQVQGELALATQQWEVSKAALEAEEQSVGGTGQSVVARSQLDEILRSRRNSGSHALHSEAPPSLLRDASLASVTASYNRKNRRRSGGPLSLAPGALHARRGSLDRAASLDAKVTAPDSRDSRHQLDRDLQKIASALRASVAAGEAAAADARLCAPAVGDDDAVHSFDQFLSVTGGGGGGDGATRSALHRKTKSSSRHHGTSSLRVPRADKHKHRRGHSAAVADASPDPDFLRQMREQVAAAAAARRA